MIVKDGVIVGRGWTQDGGRPHAEIEALRRAKKMAQGATMYVTLEPCAHHGKTPPCADAIIRSGIARVVSALEDPNPEVAGQGHERMRAKGITVEFGLCADQARRDHAGHITRMTQDGRTLRSSSRFPLTARQGCRAGNRFRSPMKRHATGYSRCVRADAIMVGIGTVLADDPQLTCRLPGMFERSPVRVVLDEKLILPLSTSVVATIRETPTWVFTSHKPSQIAEEILQEKGCKVFRVDESGDRLDLKQVLKVLAEQGVTRLMVEGGPILAASFVESDLVDEAVLLHCAKSVGAGGIDPLEGMPLAALTGRMTSLGSEKLDVDTIETFVRA